MKEVNHNFTLSWQELIRKQNSDLEIRQLCQHALGESKVSNVPRYCFLKQRVLMRKWRPPLNWHCRSGFPVLFSEIKVPILCVASFKR